MLEARSLTKYYNHTPAVRQVSFTVRPGEILGYLGPNGAGKSTTVKMLTGLIEPSEGQIFYRGRSVYEDFTAFQRRIGYVPEEAHLYPHLSGREYLQLMGRLRGMPRRVLEPKMDEFLRAFALWDDRHAPLSAYSKGMRQKILLSAALLHDPDVLILDEPFSGLDVTSALMLRSLLRALAGQGKIILYSSHVLEVVEKICSTVLILRNGEVVAYDSIERLRELMSQPSLEGVFAQLTQVDDGDEVANRIVDAMSFQGTAVQPPDPAVAAGLTLYRGLANGLPHEFKNVYGEELLQTAEDSIGSVWRREGLLGLTRLLFDIAVRVPVEHLAELSKDVRYAFRSLAGSPGFTAVALISLSLAICIVTCAFSEMNGMALRSIPGVQNPEQLVALQLPASYPSYQRYRAHDDVFSSTLAYVAAVPFGVSLGGRTERYWGHLVTPSYFSTLGVRPALGPLLRRGRAAWGSDARGSQLPVLAGATGLRPIGDRQDAARQFAAGHRGRSGAERVSRRVARALWSRSLDAPFGGRTRGARTRRPGAGAPRPHHLPHGRPSAAGRHKLPRGGRTGCHGATDRAGERRCCQHAERPPRAAGGRRQNAAPPQTGPAVLHLVLYRDVGPDHADRVRQRRQHDAGAGGRQAEGDCRAPGAGRQPRPHRPPVVDGKHDRGCRRGRARIPDVRVADAPAERRTHALPHPGDLRSSAGRERPRAHHRSSPDLPG